MSGAASVGVADADGVPVGRGERFAMEGREAGLGESSHIDDARGAKLSTVPELSPTGQSFELMQSVSLSRLRLREYRSVFFSLS